MRSIYRTSKIYMKILVLSYKFFPDIGGIEVNSELLADYFHKFGAEVCVVTTSDADVTHNREFRYEVVRNPSKLALIKLYLWADTVLENNPVLNLSWPLTFIKKRHCIALNTWISRVDGSLAIQDKLKLQWLRKADVVIAVSEKVRELTFKDAIVIGNPYRDDLFVTLNENRIRDFVFLGRLVSDKGVDMAVDLLHKLNSDASFNNKTFSLTIIGDGPERNELEKRCLDYNLGNHVIFTGTLQGIELVKCLNEHKYLLAPSRWREPFGNIAIEGMACGCIPIVSDGGGLIDAVGKAGVVFERNNLESLVQNVMYLLHDTELESKLRSEFGNHLGNHKPELVAQQYFNVLQKTVNNEKH
jgi:glycosyltransferase involved in cell wall biosynthesis